MKFNPHDLHFTYSRGANRLKCYDAKGGQLLDVEARNKTTADGQLGHNGNCPAGIFLLGSPVAKNTVPFGAWFIGMHDWGYELGMQSHGRAGIGIHGGGSGLAAPFAPKQSPPWIPTHGCLRVLNQDLAEIVHLIRGSQGQGGACYITVNAPVPGVEIDQGDDWADIPADQLDPDE